MMQDRAAESVFESSLAEISWIFWDFELRVVIGKLTSKEGGEVFWLHFM